MPLSLGAHVGQQNLGMAEMRAVWRRLDDSGVDWISCWDHFYEAPPAGGTVPHFEAIATLGALCAETRRARIGCLVFYVGYRNPAALAKAAVTLDHISGGRFELGLGAGWHELEATAYGYEFPPIATRFDMLEEAFPLIRSLLTQPRTTFEGRFFRTVDASCLPAPVNGRRLPIWLGGVGPRRTPELAAACADGWNAAYVSPEQFHRLNMTIDRCCEARDRDPATLERTVNLAFMLSVDARSAARADEAITAMWGEQAERIRGGALAGTPDQAVDRIARYVAGGAHGVNVALRAPWDPEALDMYLERVIPELRTEFGSTLSV